MSPENFPILELENALTFKSFFAYYKNLAQDGQLFPFQTLKNINGGEHKLSSDLLDRANKGNLTLWHGTSFSNAKSLVRTLGKIENTDLFTSPSPYYSLVFSLTRAYQTHEAPILFAFTEFDLSDLTFENKFAGPTSRTEVDFVITHNNFIDNPRNYFIQELQFSGQKAIDRLRHGRQQIVASGHNLLDLLEWHSKHINKFGTEHLLPTVRNYCSERIFPSLIS